MADLSELDRCANAARLASYNRYGGRIGVSTWDALSEDVREHWRGIARAVLAEAKQGVPQ